MLDKEKCIFLVKDMEPTECSCLNVVICSERPCPFYKAIGEYEYCTYLDSNDKIHNNGVKRRL